MAIVTNPLLTSLRTGFNAAFAKGKSRAKSQWTIAATLIRSTTASNMYGWLGQYPQLKEWVGPRTIKSMKEYGYTITNKLFEGTVTVPRTAIEDDNLGTYSVLFEEMGYGAATHPDSLVFGVLNKGLSSTCYDGQYFFDTDHPVYENVDDTGAVQTVSNLIDPAVGSPGKPWYVLDVSRPLKPIIFQERTSPELQVIEDPRQEHVFNYDEYAYGVRYRCNVGFGFWQQAVCCRDILNADNFNKAIELIQSYKASGMRPLGLGLGGKEGTLLVVPSALNSAAENVIEKQNLAGGESNTCYGKATIINCPWLP